MHTPLRRFLAAAFALFMAGSALSQINITLGNAGFESAVTAGFPTAAGTWEGDLNSAVTFQNGVTPYAGSQMLSFLKNAPDGTTNGTSSDTIQLVDMSAYSANIAAGNFAVTLSAYFNRSDLTYNNFQVILQSYTGSLANFPTAIQANAYTAVQTGNLFADTSPATWEVGTVSLTLPTDTTYIAMIVSLLHGNNSPSVSAPGYYADNVSLTAVPEPATCAAIFGLGALGLAAWRCRRARVAA